MANLFVRNDGSNTSPYDTWAKAATTLATAISASATGDTIYVGDGHSEATAAAVDLDPTSGKVLRILCVDDTGDPASPTTLATGGTIATATGGAARDIKFHDDGQVYVYGLTFAPSQGGTDASEIQNPGNQTLHWTFDTCTFILPNSAGERMALNTWSGGSNDAYMQFDNCTFTFNHANQGFDVHHKIAINGGSVGGTAVTTLFQAEGRNGEFHLFGLDCSGITGTLYSDTNPVSTNHTVRECKLGSGVTISGTTWQGGAGASIVLVNSDSSDTNHRYHRANYRGTETSETTVVLDASDGTTTFSRKIVTTANALEWWKPYRSLPISVWNDTVGSSQTATVEIVTDNVTLQDDEAWIEVEYLGTSGFPLGLAVDDRAASVLATPANQTTSSASWTTTGLTTPVKQALSVSFTAQEKGLVRAFICLAKPSTTMYYNPKIDLS